MIDQKHTIVIGDIHGREIWRKILKDYSGEQVVVFMGDYFDTFEFITTQQQVKNFRSILALKMKYPDKVKLLIGNHDYHYLLGTFARYSGHQTMNAAEITAVLEPNLMLMQMCYVDGFRVFTHAGVTKTWCKNNNIDVNGDLEKQINELFKNNRKSFGFCIGAIDQTGDDPIQSPIWVRPGSLLEDAVEDKTMIVGHTQVDKPRIKPPVVMVDTLATGYFVEIFNNTLRLRNVSDHQ